MMCEHPRKSHRRKSRRQCPVHLGILRWRKHQLRNKRMQKRSNAAGLVSDRNAFNDICPLSGPYSGSAGLVQSKVCIENHNYFMIYIHILPIVPEIDYSHCLNNCSNMMIIITFASLILYLFALSHKLY